MEEWIVEKEDIATGNPGEDDHDSECVVGKGLEDGDLLHVRDDISGEYFRWTVVIEFLFGEGIHLLPGHVPDIREVYCVDRDEADEEYVDILPHICEREFPLFDPGEFDRGTESVENGHDAEYREDEYGGELYGLCETEDNAGDDEVLRRRMLQKTHEEECRDEDSSRDTEVGRDEVCVGDDIRIEGKEENGEDAGESADAFSRYPIEEICGEERKEDDGETGEEDEKVGIIAESIEKERPDIPLFIHPLGPQGIGDRKSRIEREEGESDDILQKWWVLVIDTHVAIADRAIGCGDMRPFIIGRGVRPGRSEGEPEEDSEYERDDDCRVALYELE